MSEKTFDLKKLMLLIQENKEFNANFCLDEGCLFQADDAAQLIKVINYIINYLTPLTQKPLEVALDLRPNDFILNMMAYTDQAELPEVHDQIPGILKKYSASIERVQENGKYVQLKLIFSK
jgi:hypothetical protein